jgi:predicted metal-dependent phosphotriesterase family hydrolase
MASAGGESERAFVRTVRGDMRPEDVGFTHCHEHTFILPGPSCRVSPDLLLDDLDKTVAELAEFYAAGGRTVVDAQPIGAERAPRLQRLASERSKVNIVATTGFHRAIYYAPGHFRFHEPAEKLAERMVAEVTMGMMEYSDAGEEGRIAGQSHEEGRITDPSYVGTQTDVRAGLLKMASDYHLIDAQAEKVAEAVAIAHHQTGAPIITHTEVGTCALEQIRLFKKLGVPASALLLSHLDRNPDPFLHEEIADTGAYLVYDGISRVNQRPDSTIVNLICRLAESGHARRILLGMDMGRRTVWRSYGGGPGMTYMANTFLRRLRMAGLGNEQVTMFTEYNPAAALAFRRR